MTTRTKGKFKVEYKGEAPKLGRPIRFEFLVVKEPGHSEEWIVVRVLELHLPDQDATDKLHVQKRAAKAVQLHLLGKLNENHYMDGDIWLGSDWTTTEIIENYNEFEVILPKPPMGLVP